MSGLKTTTLFNEKYCEVRYDEENKIVIARWKGFLTLEQITTGCKVVNDTIKNNKLTLHISDQSLLKVLSKEAQEFLTGTWFGQVDKLVLKKIAILVAEDIFAQASVNKVNMLSKYNELQMNTVQTEEQCYFWLKQ